MNKRQQRTEERNAARAYVLRDLNGQVLERKRIVGTHPRGAVGDVYRREILRLWRVALRAVREAA